MPTLTLEQSKNGARRSVEVRRSNAIELQHLRARVKELEGALPAQAVIQPKPEPWEILTRTREHIDAIDKLISDCVDAKEMDALTRSREREWRIFAHLSNLPGPGNLKPGSPRQQTRPRTVEPLPCGPTHTIYSVPQGQPTPSTPQDAQSIEPKQGAS